CFGAAVGADRVQRRVFCVGCCRAAVEDVVGADLHEQGTVLGGGGGEVAGPDGVHGVRFGLVAFGVVDFRVGARVDDDVVPGGCCAHRIQVRHVEFGAPGGGELFDA